MKKIILLCCVLLVTTGCGNKTNVSQKGSAKGIQIKGSDTMVNLVQAWAEEFSKNNPEINIGITGGGSGTGFAALLNGTCDIAMSSRLAEDKELSLAREKKIKMVQFIVGLDGLAVIVNPKNPVFGLTMNEIRDIFIGAHTNWKDFGGLDKKIVILSRESNSGTHVFFKEHVLKRGNNKSPEEFSPDALLMPSSQTIVNEIVQNPSAIGYVGMGYISPELKPISIAKDKKSKYVEPSIKNVIDNSYPISRPLYLYTNGEPVDNIKKFIEFALSDEGQKIVKKTDFVPIKKYITD